MLNGDEYAWRKLYWYIVKLDQTENFSRVDLALMRWTWDLRMFHNIYEESVPLFCSLYKQIV